MKRFLLAGGVFVLVVAVTVAQDTKPAQPPANPIQPKAVQPKAGQIQPVLPGGAAQPALSKAAANRIAAAEEEVETLEAHRDTRNAHVRAAEVAVEMTRVKASRTNRLVQTGAVTKEEADTAKLEVEMAKAQLEIRIAEMKEVEVKIKYAKKRLDDAKASGVRPPPARQVDPPPPQ